MKLLPGSIRFTSSLGTISSFVKEVLCHNRQEHPEHHHPHSDRSNANLADHDSISVLDRAWYKVVEQEPDAQGMYLTPYPEDEEDAIEIIAYQDNGSWYNRNEYYFDQYTLERYRVQGDVYEEAGFADQLMMLNYDIHVGAVWGLPGKILAFLVSLVSASLPVTGFLVWWNRKKKEKKVVQKKPEKKRVEESRQSAVA